MKKRVLAFILSMVMLITLLPTAVFAASSNDSDTLTLEYDDRYELEDGYVVVSITDETATSYVVEGGEKTSTKDTSVISYEDGYIIADGVGTATLITAPEGYEDNESKWVITQVTVTAATLTIIYLAGQSNMEAMVSTNTGYEIEESVACTEGEVYSTFAPRTASSGEYETGIAFSQACTADNAEDFVAGSLTSEVSISGEELEYPTYALTYSGLGKTGPDSGIAYKWNELTGDKVWIINAAWGGTSIANWQEGTKYYERALAVFEAALQTYEAEIAAGHYTAGDSLMFWMQGEADKSWTATKYASYYTAMCESFKSALGIDAFGAISIRSCMGSYTNEDDLYMIGPKIAQYYIGQNADYDYIYVVSNANEAWVSDEGVEEYFAEKYSAGYLDYPRRDTSTKFLDSLPTTVAEIHNDIHYSQIGHNENGITAAEGMYEALYGDGTVESVEWRDENGESYTSLAIEVDEEATVIAVADPICNGKNVTYKVSNDNISYDASTGIVTGVSIGTATIEAYVDGEVISDFSVTVSEATLNGLYYTDESGWAYYTHGAIDTSYTGLAENDYGTWYVVDGIVDFSYTGLYYINGTWYYLLESRIAYEYTGLASNSAGTWYVEEGIVDFGYTGLATVDGVTYYVSGNKVSTSTGLYYVNSTWYYFVNGAIASDYTGLASNSAGTWYVEEGIVDFGYTGLATVDGVTYYVCKNLVSTETGLYYINSTWYYIVDGIVAYDYTGLAVNSAGNWYYVINGIVDRAHTGLYYINSTWYYLLKSRVAYEYTGFASNSAGTWYVEEGIVDFGYTGLVTVDSVTYYVSGSKVSTSTGLYYINSTWYYIVDGIVAYDYTGLAVNSAGNWYYVIEGIVDRAHTGVYEVDGVLYYLIKSRVAYEYTGFVSDDTGTWYVEEGIVDSDYSGLICVDDTIYYISSGELDTAYIGLAEYTDGNTYYIKNGIAYTSFTGFYKADDDTWYYIKKGIFQSSFKGIVTASSTKYYVKNGMVAWSYTGTVKCTNGVAYRVKNGVVYSSYSWK